MVGLAQLVERKIVALEVKGSIPLSHPIKKTIICKMRIIFFKIMIE